MERIRKILIRLMFVSWLCCGTAMVARGEYRYRVKVTDENTHEAVAGASVSFLGSDSIPRQSVFTDERGLATANLTAGAELLKITSVGYGDLYRQLLPADTIGIIECALPVNPVELKEVMVTASNRREDADNETFLISKAMRKNALTTASLLQNLPGISVNPVTEDIKIGNESNILLTVNGKEVSQSYVLGLKQERVKSVELLRNPSGKYAGYPVVMNIVLRDDYEGVDVGAQGRYMQWLGNGNAHRENVGVNLTATKGSWNYFLSGEYSGGKSYDATGYSIIHEGKILADGMLPPASDPNKWRKPQLYRVNGGVDWRISPRHTLSAQLWYDRQTQDEQEKVNSTVSTENGESISTRDYDTDNYAAGVYYTGRLTDSFRLDADVTYNHYNVDETRDFRYGGTSTPSLLDGDKNYLQVSAKGRYTVDRHWNLTGSYVYTLRDYHTDDLSGLTTRLSESRHLPTLEASYSAGRAFNISFGGSWQYISKSNDDLSRSQSSFLPRGNIYWKIAPWVKFNLRYSCHVDYPNLDLLSPQVWKIYDGLYHSGNPDLKAKVMHHCIASLTFLDCLKLEYMMRTASNDISPVYAPISGGEGAILETYANSRIIHQYMGVQYYKSLGRDVSVDANVNYQWYNRRYDHKDGKGRSLYLDMKIEWNVLGSGYLLAGEYFMRDDRMPLPQGKGIHPSGESESIVG